MQFSWENSLLVTCKILGLCFNTLTADDKYCLLNKDNLSQDLLMQLSQKRKTYSLFFFWFFLHVGNLDSIFNIFKKNDDPHG